MSIDYQTLLYNPIYENLGVPATIITTNLVEIAVTAQNRTAASMYSGVNTIEFQAFRPTALVRMAEIVASGINAVDDIQEGQLVMDGKTWSIKSYEYLPAPTGINDGELRLILKDDVDV